MNTPTTNDPTADPTKTDLTNDPTNNDLTTDPTPDTATNATTNPTPNHFRLWVTLALFSIVSLVSMTNFFGQRTELGQDHSHKDWTKDQRAVVSVAIISLALSFYGTVTHFINKEKFPGTNFEFGLVRSRCFWVYQLASTCSFNNVFAWNIYGIVGKYHFVKTS